MTSGGTMRAMNRRRTLFYLLAILASAGLAIALQPWALFHREPEFFVANMGQYYPPGDKYLADATARLRLLPPPDFSHPGLWQKIPRVILTNQGAFINGATKPVPFDAVISTLANLTEDDWPSGRLISYFPYPPGLYPRDQTDPPAAAVHEIEDNLREAGIAWPPAMSD